MKIIKKDKTTESNITNASVYIKLHIKVPSLSDGRIMSEELWLVI